MTDETPLRRRNPRSQGGRPRLEEIDYFTPEMEEIAQFTRAGFTIIEIAEKLKCTTERIEKLLKNPLVKARVQRLYGDRLTHVALEGDRLWDAVIASTVRLLADDHLPPTQMEDLLKRLDPYERLDKMLTNDEQRLLKDKGQRLLGSGTAESEGSTPIAKSIFDIKEE